MKSLILLVLIFIGQNAKAQEGVSSNGVGISPSIGYTYIEISNPDNTKSNYNGFTLQLEFNVPLYRGDGNGLDLHLFYKNAFVENLSNNDSLSEKARFYGPGAGLSYSYGSWGLGANYNFVKASHSTNGVYSQNTEYDFKTLTYYLDFANHQSEFTFGARVAYESGEIPKSETNYSKDVDYTAYTGWIYFVYNTSFELF